MNKLGIYVHIPFCRSKCTYCDFYSCPDSEQVMDEYLHALSNHLKESSAYTKNTVVDSIYIGGGTPSFFGERRLKELLKQLYRRFRVAKDAEVTVECNPDSATEKLFHTLTRCGVNRISLGAQSAVDEELKIIGRVHTFEQVQQAVALARAAKIKNISLDLIYGLPLQTKESFADSLEAIAALEPEHISCYGLKVEEGTPLYRQVERGLLLPDDDMQADMYLQAVDYLAQHHYKQYEISNFARPGMQSRHNLKYWMGQEYLGFGPGAHSYMNGRRFSIVKDTQKYIEHMTSGAALLDESETLDRHARACEYLMLRLRTLRGIEEWEYRREFLMNFEPVEKKLFEFELGGYVVRDDRRWHLTPKGFLLSNLIIATLLDVQEEQKLDTLLPQFRQRSTQDKP